MRGFGCCGFGCCGGILLGLGGVLKRKDAVKDGAVAFIQGVALNLAQGCCVTLGLQQSLFKGGALARNGGSSLGRLLNDALGLLRGLGCIGGCLLLVFKRVDALLDGPVGWIERFKLALAQRRCVALQLQQALFKPQALVCDGCGGLRGSGGLSGKLLLCFGGILQMRSCRARLLGSSAANSSWRSAAVSPCACSICCSKPLRSLATAWTR